MDDIDELQDNQQQILQTINNGLKSKVKENYEDIKFLKRVIIGGLGSAIALLITITWQLAKLLAQTGVS